nr:hypothetical protein [Tanacetum cinerariifolium]
MHRCMTPCVGRSSELIVGLGLMKKKRTEVLRVWKSGAGQSEQGLKRAQNHIKSSTSSLQEDTSSIKSMMTEMYNAFGGQSSSAHSSSVTLTFALTDTLAQPITIIHPEPSVPQREGKGIEIDDQTEDQRKLVKASSIFRPNPDEPEEIKKAEEEARLNDISKTKVIKVIREEAKKLGIHLKEAITTKSAFGISELDELREIIPKKKNTVVKDLMNSLSQRYERLRQIPRELRIQSALSPQNKPYLKPQEENKSTWNLSLKQESLDWNAIELSLKMSRS